MALEKGVMETTPAIPHMLGDMRVPGTGHRWFHDGFRAITTA